MKLENYALKAWTLPAKGSFGKQLLNPCANPWVTSKLTISLKLSLNSLSNIGILRKLQYSEIRNDTEPNTNYVRVMDPRAEEISFVRTSCLKKQALYVSCENLGNYAQFLYGS